MFFDYVKRRAKTLNTIRMKLCEREWFTWGRTKRIVIQTCIPRKDPWIYKIDNGHFSYEQIGKEISDVNIQAEEYQDWYPKMDEPRDLIYNEYHMLQRHANYSWSYGHHDNYDDEGDYPFDEIADHNINNY